MQQNFGTSSNKTPLNEAEEYLLSLADSMASAATTFNSHGYEIFLQARSEFINQLHKILQSE